MIHHVSIPAREPRHVAEVLAELMGGRCYPFGPLPGAFMAVSGDSHGTMIEVYPEASALSPGTSEDPVTFVENERTPPTWPFHLLLSVPTEQGDIEHIGEREGWRTKLFGRGMPGEKPLFHVIEFWIENRLMVEVVPREMARDYEELLQFSSLDAMMGARQPQQ
jgi:hypothetical protein